MSLMVLEIGLILIYIAKKLKVFDNPWEEWTIFGGLIVGFFLEQALKIIQKVV